MTDEDVVKRRVARQIINMIEMICYSKEFAEYRVNLGSNGVIELILKDIEETYLVE